MVVEGLLVVWAVAEHCVAMSYRRKYEVARVGSPVSIGTSNGGWRVWYKEGNRTQSIDVAGATEGDAVRNAVRSKLMRFDHVIRTERI